LEVMMAAVHARICRKIRERDYYLSLHAEKELLEDQFERSDMEHAILQGFVEKKLTHDPTGTRYLIVGPTPDGRTMGVVCRFRGRNALIIITVFEVGD